MSAPSIASGNFLWAKSTERRRDLLGHGLKRLPSDQGGIYVAGGFFVGTADFDPGAGPFNLDFNGRCTTASCGISTPAATSSGPARWAVRVTIRRMASASMQSATFTSPGTLTARPTLIPGPGTYNLTSAGGNDFFVAKLVQPVALAATASQPQSDSLLLATTPTRRLSSKAADSALADLGDDDADRLERLAG